jgi:decaprenyl-phosphate phosphoribosyltransferase
MFDIFLLIRPREWTKNLVIFLPSFFALQIHHPLVLAKAVLAFAIFCALAGSVYIFNDYFDIKADRLHPQKKMRPLAARRVSKKKALSICAVLLTSGLIGSWLFSFSIFYCALIYIGLNILYTIKFKHIPIVDIFIVATCFVIRIIVGGVATGVALYPWIIIMTFLLSLLLALGKRRDDILIFLNNGELSRKSINGYNLTFIDSCIMVMAAIVIVSYIMFTMSYETIAKFKTDNLYLTAIFVILGILRYLQIIMVEQRSSAPSEILLQDYFIQILIIGWITMFGLLIYL